nr:serine hydroxymethyltransferase [Ignavibacteria bacterium]
GPRGGMILMGTDFENPFGLKAPKSGRTKMMSELIDSMVIPGIQGGPLMHVIAAKAVAFKEALEGDFTKYAEQVIKNAKALSNKLTGYGFKIISGGTDNHLMLIDLRNKNITGKAAQESLDAIGITCNKNSVPFDDKSPMITSGIRLGTPALTTRGMKEKEMEIIAGMINDVIASPDSDDVKKDIRKKIDDITAEFPLYPELFTW